MNKPIEADGLSIKFILNSLATANIIRQHYPHAEIDIDELVTDVPNPPVNVLSALADVPHLNFSLDDRLPIRKITYFVYEEHEKEEDDVMYHLDTYVYSDLLILELLDGTLVTYPYVYPLSSSDVVNSWGAAGLPTLAMVVPINLDISIADETLGECDGFDVLLFDKESKDLFEQQVLRCIELNTKDDEIWGIYVSPDNSTCDWVRFYLLSDKTISEVKEMFDADAVAAFSNILSGDLLKISTVSS